MSNYYVQSNATGQPGQMYFSDWSGNESQGSVGTLNVQSAPLIPEPPVQYANPPHPSQSQSDPNATPLVREHFRTSNDNAIPKATRSRYKEDDETDTSKCGDSKFWTSVIVGGLVLFVFIALIMYACQSGGSGSSNTMPQMASSANFGSATLNANLLNDLEFL